MSSVDGIGSITSYKDVYISNKTVKSWKKATKRCEKFGMNIFILKTISEKLKLLSIHDSYEFGSEWIAITDAERNCPPSNYKNKNSLFYDCEFIGMCYPYSFTSSSNIICQTGKKYLCEKIVDTKELEGLTMTTLEEIESTTQKSEIKIIHNQIKINDEPMVRKIYITKQLTLEYIILFLLTILASFIIILCCRRKCTKVYSSTDTTIILTNKCDALFDAI